MGKKNRVTGIGGVFFKCQDAAKMREWYRDQLGIVSDEYGGVFEWRQADEPEKPGFTAFSTFNKDSDYFNPSKSPFMLNFRVNNLEGILKDLKKEGIEQIGEIQDFDYGRFGWIVDPEGNKIELWEPKDETFSAYYKGKTTR
jgi:predicted enzyme related to lactoylglutathione lyase